MPFMSTSSKQFQLLKQRRFAPLFWVQFFGALNDNVYRYTLVTLVIYKTAELGLQQTQATALPNLFAALFILPYILFSASAGQFADKYEKSRLIHYIKAWEVVIAIIASVGLYLNNLVLLSLTLFLLGLQSTMFGPIKFSILPQQLQKSELTSGNGLISMGTFIAILLGTIIGGLLIMIEPYGIAWASFGITSIALVGFSISLLIPKTERADPNLRINVNVFKSTWQLMKYLQGQRKVFWVVLLISCFWAYGVLFLTQVTNYTKFVLGGDSRVNVLLLATFSIGIGIGSLLCSRFSRRDIEIGLVPIGAICVSIFTLLWYFVSPSITTQVGPHLSITQFLHQPSSWLIMLAMLCVCISAGIFVVPLQAYVQYHTPPEYRSRVIAVLNVYNAFTMVLASLLATVWFAMGLGVLALFLFISVANLVVCCTVFIAMPDYLQHAKRLLSKKKGNPNIPGSQ